MRKIDTVPEFDSLDKSNLSKTLLHEMPLVRSFNERYLHWEEMGYRVDDEKRNDVWVAMKVIRMATAEPVAIGNIEINYNITPEMRMMLHDIDHRFIATDNGKSFVKYRISSVMEEAIASSQMEGAVTTRDAAKRMLRRGEPLPKTVSDRMILNNYRAMEFIKEIVDEKMTPSLILKMHAVITDKLLDGWEGRFREDDETVVGDPLDENIVYHQPPGFKDVPMLMQSLCDFIDSEDDMHPIIKGIMIHFMIGHIHPFRDGNGRLARSMFYWYVMKHGYGIMEYTSVSRIIKRSRSNYNTAYQYSESDGNDVTYFLKYNLGCIVKALDELEDYIGRKTSEIEKGELMIDIGCETNRNEKVIFNDYKKSGQRFTIKEISKRYGFAYQSARNYVNHLLELQKIKAVGKEGKTVLYVVVR